MVLEFNFLFLWPEFVGRDVFNSVSSLCLAWLCKRVISVYFVPVGLGQTPIVQP